MSQVQSCYGFYILESGELFDMACEVVVPEKMVGGVE